MRYKRLTLTMVVPEDDLDEVEELLNQALDLIDQDDLKIYSDKFTQGNARRPKDAEDEDE